MKTIKDIDVDDYGLTLTDKYRKNLKKEILKSSDLEMLKENLIKVIDDIYSEIDSITREDEDEHN